MRCYILEGIRCPGAKGQNGRRELLQTHSASVAPCTFAPMIIAWNIWWHLTKQPATHKLVRIVIYQPYSGEAQVHIHNYELCGPRVLSCHPLCETWLLGIYCIFFCGAKKKKTSHECLWKRTTTKVFSVTGYISIPLKCVRSFISHSICSALETANQTTNLALF